ncbi:WD repeat protein-like protein [Xylona heveae TC161]|uniref:WD repeat protein-like protein n=1 Tax=Xylona heveae (strain CBS 132557 / TC161) TaxID=1328760 RepID=A0A164ZPD4_XYLHT|nr:WD repeat protein-like protein [Xylona heveae TC161]KZF19341.1 WD repeat protein-like protein [Xylona heveae TC161]
MARKARQRISYVLPLARSTGGHLLGVNGLAVDKQRSILYSGGRDGVICAWDVSAPGGPHDDPESGNLARSTPSNPSASLRTQAQAHTHWVNDIVLTQNNSALVSASSDITVKLWRPDAEDGQLPQTIGLHSDYVKCLASPGPRADWVASGALDKKVCLWDLAGGGERLQINVGEGEASAKGSVYALSARDTILACGGPESIVRVWDPRSGRRITNFVGHTDNVRDILISEDGGTIMSASSDQTVKVWSVTAGRCMHTLTMHNDSVWSLYSDHPHLSVFYSGDRSGLIAKTDSRRVAECSDGMCIAVCQEHEGINKVVASDDSIWTATSSSSINRWSDVDTDVDVQLPENMSHRRHSSIASRSRFSLSGPSNPSTGNDASKKQIPMSCLLRLSNTATFPFPSKHHRDSEAATVYSAASIRRGSETYEEESFVTGTPLYQLPIDCIEGQHGLIKHVMLNDRRRVLTLDTTGEVMMWDLVKCVCIKSFGKRHLEDVAPEVNTTESVANWCAVDTRTGRLTCILTENYCFDAEVYADELNLDQQIEFREDQRINLGKWVLRYLFANLIDEEIKRDGTYRAALNEGSGRSEGPWRRNAPPSIELPPASMNGWQAHKPGPSSALTPQANGYSRPAVTPGLSIGLATPNIQPMMHTQNAAHKDNTLPAMAEEGSDLEKRVSHHSQSTASMEKPTDYFSAGPVANPPVTPGGSSAKGGEGTLDENAPLSPQDGEKGTPAKEGGSRFSKKFRMSFSTKKNPKPAPAEAPKPAPVDEKSEDSDAKSSGSEEKSVEDNFFGVVQKIRYGYQDAVQAQEEGPLAVGILPSLPNETPVLKPPPETTVIIQEEHPDLGGVADLFRGTVASVGKEADAIEKLAPMWLGDLLIRNQIPVKDMPKISFVLYPYQDLLPSVAGEDGSNTRLNANRMLRARKILGYVAERIEPQPEKPDPDALKPEEYLELYCQNQVVLPTMTLATLRTYVWKGGGDIVLYYKANGKKAIGRSP